MSNSCSKIEVLAPCGSYETLTAAVCAGADACYFGGSCFGARAYAENFNDAGIQKAVSYAHLHGVKVYLTVNTLVKQEEFHELYDAVRPFYEAGGDALIIQDLGAFSYLRRQFPDIALHCSTQMNLTSCYGASLMKEQGASRIVCAREMSLSEIRAIKEHVAIEVETFVHGAMCYSYSGQCLMSSLAGGRSGNRGRCAQPCRKRYDGEYLLSMKDLCALKQIPKLIAAGVDSLKIEGRMKNADYTASAVYAYRTIADDCINGCYDEKKAEALSFWLANIYNRGGFTDGYFCRSGRADMISRERPNNQGVLVGDPVRTKSGTVTIRLSEDIYRQDVLELAAKDGGRIEITSPVDAQAGTNVTLNCPATGRLETHKAVFRTKCPKLLREIPSRCRCRAKIPVKLTCTARLGQPLTISASAGIAGRRWETSVSGITVEKSSGKPWEPASVRKPFAQLGNTDWELSEFVCDAEPDCFLPAGVLKQMRREVLDKLEALIVSAGVRTAAEQIPWRMLCDSDCFDGIKAESSADVRLYIGIQTVEQFETVLRQIAEHALAVFGCTVPVEIYESCKKKAGADLRIYAELPHVIRGNHKEYLQDCAIRGIYIKNIDGLAIAAQANLADDCEILCDAGLYCYNHPAFAFVKDVLRRPVSFLLPRELNLHELQDLTGEPLCLTLYEYQPVMITANCVRRTKGSCTHTDSLVFIRDEMGHTFPVRTDCKNCYNVIYNQAPFSVLDTYKEDAFSAFRAGGCMIRFTVEEPAAITRVLSAFAAASGDIGPKTNGHLYRGVQ